MSPCVFLDAADVLRPEIHCPSAADEIKLHSVLLTPLSPADNYLQHCTLLLSCSLKGKENEQVCKTA